MSKPKLTSKDIEELQAFFPKADKIQKVKLQKLLKLYASKVVEESGKETFLDFNFLLSLLIPIIL